MAKSPERGPEEIDVDPGGGAFSEEDPEADQAVSPGVAVVAVGASAGGMEAFSEFLGNLPENTGMAFVLIQHLPPYQQSNLAGLLAHLTPMPVKDAWDGAVLEPNRIYVLLPGRSAALNGNTLSIGEPGSIAAKPIDAFFASVARERGPGAIGVVLSGMASDGTLGLKAIKSSGGVTFAQDSSAKFDSMPQSAMQAGVVDFVLPPGRIAAELASIVHHPYYAPEAQRPPILPDGPTLLKVIGLLRSRTGVDFGQYKHPTVQRRLLRRMALRRAETLEQYYAGLQNDAAEIESLFQDLLINVTEFFRDPDVFESLKRNAFPAIFKGRREGESVRVWIPGCSTGEEVYSIAMSLVEYLTETGQDFPLMLFGTDVSERVISRARAGLYNESAVSVLSPERLQRFFVRCDGGYQISRSIREACIFSRHNVAKDPPLSRMHLISCRNLLIYLTPLLQRRVISTFGYALQSDGCLVLGSSETLGALSDGFQQVDPEHKIFLIKSGVERSAFSVQMLFNSYESDAQHTVSRQAQQSGLGYAETADLEQYVDRLLLTRYSPPSFVVNGEGRIVERRGEIARFLDPQAAYLEPDLIRAVREELKPVLNEALSRVKANRRVYKGGNVILENAQGNVARVDVTVMPVGISAAPKSLLVLIEDPQAPGPSSQGSLRSGDDRADDIQLLEQELASTRHYLQAIIEELRSSNEEAQSANEELQSTNEELQTAKEELQSSNEELNTINAEMQSRNLELAQVNDDLTNLLSSMNMPIVMLGRDLRIRRFTPLAQSVLRLIPTDVGRPISDLQLRIKVPDLGPAFRQVLDTLVPFEREVEDEENHAFLLRIRPYLTADHRVDGAVLQVIDIAEMKRSLEEARRARDYAEAIIDTVTEPLIVIDSSLTIRSVNRSFTQYFRVTPEEAIGQNLYRIRGEQFRDPVLSREIERVRTENVIVNGLEIQLDVDQSGLRIFSVNARMIQGLNSEHILLVGFQDITDRKRAAEARYRRLFETAHDGIVIIDAETGVISDVNPAMVRTVVCLKSELVGTKFWESPLFEGLPQGAGALQRIRDQGVVRYSDVSIKSSEGRTFEFEIVANVYSEGERRVIQFNLRDLTDRRKFERELQQTARLESIGLLAGGIAHDFNNLLTGVLGNAALVYSDLPVGHPNRPLLREIQQSADRAALLTRQMLAYAGKARLSKERICLSEFVPEILPLVQVSISKSTRLILDFKSDTPDIDADPAQLQHLLMNLLINAAEAIGEDSDGRIELCTSLRTLTLEEIARDFAGEDLGPGEYALVQVIDTGSGMDEETKRKIFDPFFTTKFTGRGLGLAAAQGIIRQHGGSIHVFSAPGKGSAFQMLFPESRLPPRAPEIPIRSQSSVSPGGTVLVVDDEPGVRNLVRRTLEKARFNVEVAENGRQGLDKFLRQPDRYRIVILDVLMPEMGASEVFSAIHAVRPNVPIILMSGLDENDVLRRLQGNAVESFIQKPFTPEWLLQSVFEALERGM